MQPGAEIQCQLIVLRQPPSDSPPKTDAMLLIYVPRPGRNFPEPFSKPSEIMLDFLGTPRFRVTKVPRLLVTKSYPARCRRSAERWIPGNRSCVPAHSLIRPRNSLFRAAANSVECLHAIRALCTRQPLRRARSRVQSLYIPQYQAIMLQISRDGISVTCAHRHFT
jgi:hypothetical protein